MNNNLNNIYIYSQLVLCLKRILVILTTNLKMKIIPIIKVTNNY